MDDAEDAYWAKLSEQSKMLEAAVQQYREQATIHDIEGTIFLPSL